MKRQSIKIALFDEQKILIESLSNSLKENKNICQLTAYSRLSDLREGIEKHRPDILITEILLRQIYGVEMISNLKAEFPWLKIVVLSSIKEIKTIQFAIQSGVNGYISKEASMEELNQAIFAVYEGETYIGLSLRKKVLSRNNKEKEESPFHLTEREKEVLVFVCQGLTIKEAAQKMAISKNTAQAYYKNLMGKLNINRTADVIVYAIKTGIYNPDTTV